MRPGVDEGGARLQPDMCAASLMERMSKLNKRPSACRGYVSIVENNVPSLALIDSSNLWRRIISKKVMNKLQITKDELRPLSITSFSTAKEGVTLQVLGETKKDPNQHTKPKSAVKGLVTRARY